MNDYCDFEYARARECTCVVGAQVRVCVFMSTKRIRGNVTIISATPNIN